MDAHYHHPRINRSSLDQIYQYPTQKHVHQAKQLLIQSMVLIRRQQVASIIPISLLIGHFQQYVLAPWLIQTLVLQVEFKIGVLRLPILKKEP